LVLAEREEFVEATLALLNDPARRQRLGRQARRFAAARDWRAIAGALSRIHQGERVDFEAKPSLDAHLPPRQISKPLSLLLLINRGCNLRCRFCDLWQNPQNMPTPRVRDLIDEAVKIGTQTLVITGGEPLLHPDLPEIIRYARQAGLGVNLTSNGTLLDRHYDRLVAAGLQSISLSIDGLPATHDQLRGQKGAHARTWQSLMHCTQDKRMDVCVYFVVTSQNVHELIAVWEQVRATGARFDFWPVNDAPELYLRTEKDQQYWREAVHHIAKHDTDVAARAHYYEEGLRYHAGESGPVRCLGLVDQYGVTFEGDLLPCCVWGGEGLKVGNVFQTPLSQLWYSPEVQQAREHLYRDGCTAGCYNHSLYEFVVSTGASHRVHR
jgi:MoaA/NifB/PqqE/SkfB family radical SAM enzyme